MRKLEIYNAEIEKNQPLEKILPIMTDDWIDDYASGHTVSDMRDALKELLDWKKRVEAAANEVIVEFDEGVHGESVSIWRLKKELEE